MARTGLIRNPGLLREEGFDEEVRWLIRNEVENEDLRSLRELHVVGTTRTPLFDTLVGADRDPTFDCTIASKAKSEREKWEQNRNRNRNVCPVWLPKKCEEKVLKKKQNKQSF